jgi:uncharacterized protein (TIGR02599 family)
MRSAVHSNHHQRRAFSLVEVLVATAILAILLVALLTLTSQTIKVWLYTTSKIEEFRAPREAFESMTRHLSQATLNTYWDYDSVAAPTRYVRQSELRFVCGPMADLAGAAPAGKTWVTHGTFFQAPLGFVGSPTTLNPAPTGLINLLNTWGYFIEFGDDSAIRPSFVTSPLKYRFRICEFMQPSNDLNLFSFTSGNPDYAKNDWYLASLNTTVNRPVHFLADNVVALVFVPKLSPQEDASQTELAPTLIYDSTQKNPNPAINPKNQLPPVIQVTMIAMDEPSAIRLSHGSTMPNLGLSSLFVSGSGAAAKVATDLQTLQTTLTNLHVNYRVFTTDVVIHGAHWSTEETN